jgi:hypothetical protein
VDREQLLVEQRKRDEERELAQRAEETRVRRFEEEQATIDAERRADRELLAMVPRDRHGWRSEWFDTLKKSLAVIEEERSSDKREIYFIAYSFRIIFIIHIDYRVSLGLVAQEVVAVNAIYRRNAEPPKDAIFYHRTLVHLTAHAILPR